MKIIATTLNEECTRGAFIDDKHETHGFTQDVKSENVYAEVTSDGGYIFIIKGTSHGTRSYHLTAECYEKSEIEDIYRALTGEDMY